MAVEPGCRPHHLGKLRRRGDLRRGLAPRGRPAALRRTSLGIRSGGSPVGHAPAWRRSATGEAARLWSEHRRNHRLSVLACHARRQQRRDPDRVRRTSRQDSFTPRPGNAPVTRSRSVCSNLQCGWRNRRCRIRRGRADGQPTGSPRTRRRKARAGSQPERHRGR